MHTDMTTHMHRRTEESPVVEDFNSGTDKESDMADMAIEFAQSRHTCLWKIRESRWIRTLRTWFLLRMNLKVNGL